MLAPSFSRVPFAPVESARSDPAKSTREIWTEGNRRVARLVFIRIWSLEVFYHETDRQRETVTQTHITRNIEMKRAVQRKEESANLGDTFGGQFGGGVVAPLCQYDGEHGMGAGGGLVHVGGGNCPVGGQRKERE